MNTESILLDYVKREFVKGRSVKLDADTDLLNTGIIDSLGILQLVTFIENQFGIQMPDEDVVFENFQTIDALAAYLDARAG